MVARPKVLLIITQDTKLEEARYVRAAIEQAGCDVVHLDPSVRKTMGGAEIAPEQIAEAGGKTIEEVRALGHEGKCQIVMTAGAVKLATEIVGKGEIAGVLAVGGSMGTGLAGTVLQALPYGLPKLIVSTMASGFTAPYVGRKDIAMLNAVTDIAGVNSISREVFRNAANAIAGMARGYAEASHEADKPLVLIGTLGTTETCTRRIRQALEADGCEVMVFHTSGMGGPTMDAIAAERDVAAVLDLSWTEMVDQIFGGLAAGGPDRGRAALKRGIPVIFAPGNIDFIIGGPIEQSQEAYPGRRYHAHNPALTAVRTNAADLEKIAEHIAGLVGEAKGPVRVFVPLQGFSSHDSPQGHIYEPSLPRPFAEHLQAHMPEGKKVDVLDNHFNDPAFADAIVAAAREMMAAGRKA